jgi:hypothetical protein
MSVFNFAVLTIDRSPQFRKAIAVLSGGGERVYWFETEIDARNEVMIKEAPKTNESGKHLKRSNIKVVRVSN